MIDRLMEWLVGASLVVAGLCVVAIVVIGTWDTLGRLMGRPMKGSVEMTEAFLATMIFMSLAYAQRKYRHVVVDVVIQGFPKRLKYVLHFIALLFTLAAFVLLFTQSLDGAIHSWQVLEVSAGSVPAPIWLAKALATTGLAIATIETFRQIVYTVFWPEQIWLPGDEEYPELADEGSD